MELKKNYFFLFLWRINRASTKIPKNRVFQSSQLEVIKKELKKNDHELEIVTEIFNENVALTITCNITGKISVHEKYHC